MRTKSALDRQRDAAFTVQVKSRGQDQATPIVEIFPINGQLYTFKEDSIFLVQSPDDIDPARQYPDTKGTTSQVYDIGTRHPVVSRTIIQAKRILDSVILSRDLSKEHIINRYFLFFKELAICSSIYEKLVDVFLKEATEVENALQASGNSQFVGDIPRIPNLEDQARSFFLTGHKALRELSAVADLFFPSKPKKQNFKQLCEWLLKNRGEDNHLYQMMREDLEWLTLFWEIRNAIEHPNSPKYSFDVRNIELGPNCQIYGPRWRYAVPHKEQGEYVDLLRDMGVYLDNMMSFGEELFVLCVQETWSVNFPFVIFKTSPEKLNPQCPVRYGVTIDLERLRRRR